MKVITLSMLVAGAAAANLKLHAATNSHVHAEYKGLAAEVKHLGPTAGISRIYDAETGENFLQVKNVDNKVKVQYFDHPAMEFDRSAGEVPEEFGEQAREFHEHPKMALLSELSEEIGKTDAEHAVAHWVHATALSMVKNRPVEETDQLLEEEEEGGEGWWSRRRRRRRRRRRLRSFSNSIKRCSNDCFGACGPGCTEWNWVCGAGNTQAFRGCWEHDCYCSCSWWGMTHARCLSVMAHSETCNWPSCASSFCQKSGDDSDC